MPKLQTGLDSKNRKPKRMPKLQIKKMEQRKENPQWVDEIIKLNNKEKKKTKKPSSETQDESNNPDS